MKERCALRVFCTLIFCLIIITSSLASFLDEIIEISVEPSSTIVPPTTTTVTGSSTVPAYRVTPSTTSITGSSTFSLTTIMPSATQITGTSTLSTYTIAPSTATIRSVATEPLTPTIEEASYSTQAVSPDSSNIIPTAGTAKNMPNTNVASHLKTTITPIAGPSIIPGTSQSAPPTKSIITPIAGKSIVTMLPPGLTITSLYPTEITTSQSTYDAELNLLGSNFLNVVEITWSWTGPDSGTSVWQKYDERWIRTSDGADVSSKLTIHNDISMTLRPRVLSGVAGTETRTWIWSVILKDNTGATASEQFTVTYSPAGPACKIELRKNGVKIDNIDVNEFFDIVVTEYSGDIKKVRFLSDESQNGIVDEGFKWTDWYDWGISTEDWTGIWNADNKVKTWAFATPGEKEVWAEVKDSEGQTGRCSAPIFAGLELTLRWPLSGKLSDRQVLLGFGNDWTHGYCGGLPKKHTGIDLVAQAGESVYASASGVVKAVYIASSEHNWGEGIVIEHDGKFGKFTTTYLHVDPKVSVNQLVTKGQLIAAVASIEGTDHLHYGIRIAPYSEIAKRGALPQVNTQEKFCEDPVFPEKFINPMGMSYEPNQPKLREAIQNEAKSVRSLWVDGEEYYIVALETYIDPATWEAKEHSFLAEEPPVWVVYTYPDFQPISHETLLRKIWTVDRANNLLKSAGTPEIISDTINTINEVISASQRLSEAEYTAILARTEAFMFLDLVFFAELSWSIKDYGIGSILVSQLDYYTDPERFALESGRALLEASKMNYQRAREIAESYRSGISDYATAKYYLNNFYRGYFEFVYGAEMALPAEEISKPACWEIVSWLPEYIKHLALKFSFTALKYPLLGTLLDASFSISMNALLTKEQLYGYVDCLKEIEEKMNELLEAEAYPVHYTLALVNQDKDSLYEKWGIHGVDYLNSNLCSPAELRIRDPQGQVAGMVYGEVMMGIPNSFYFYNSHTITIFYPSDPSSYVHEVAGTGEGTYKLTIASVKEGKATYFTATDIPISSNVVHQYTIDWASLSIGEEGVTVQIDFDSDGAFEYAFTSDSELTRDEYMVAIDDIPPTTTLEIGEPKYADLIGNIYVSSSTQFTLTVEDNPGGTGVASTFYRIYNSTYDTGFVEYSEPFFLAGLSDGEYSIDYYSIDNIGNTEPKHTILTTLDNSGPTIIIENPLEGWALQDGVTFIASADDTCGTRSMKFSIREANGDQGIPIGFEGMPATYNASTEKWELFFDTLQLLDGFYIVIVEAEDNLGNAASITVSYSIRNWAVLELLPATPNNKAGRTMPVKFALRIAASVDPNQPFVYNEELTIKIYATDNPNNILQTSTFGDEARDYRINTIAEHYITNFQTLKTPKDYTVEIWRGNMLIGSFNFKTVK